MGTIYHLFSVQSISSFVNTFSRSIVLPIYFDLHPYQVEMVVLTRGELTESNAMLQELVDIQKEIFADLGFHYRVHHYH